MTASLKIALRDIIDGALQWPLWGSLAWRDIRQRYTRTILGPFWLTLSTAIFLTFFSLVYSKLFNLDLHNYLPYLTAGFLPWILFSAVVSESCTVFTAEKQTIANWQFPYSVFVYKVVYRNTIVFLHNFLILLVVYLIYGPVPSWNMLWLPVSLALFCLNAFWICILLGTLCARFRDVQPLVASILQITMFMTPIFWRPEMLAKRTAFIDANIVYHAIVIVRDPLLGKAPSMVSLAVSTACAILGITTALILYGRFRRRIPFWV